jgi:TetR/AcrR family transcriptional regulator, regulator of autoinduction and epiphytic fitness
VALKKKTTQLTRSSKVVESKASVNELSEFSRKKRECILQAAIETFLEHGYEGASMNRVAERAGVIKQTIYSHFKDKEALFVSTIASLTIDNFDQAFTEESIKLPPRKMLQNLAEVFVNRPQNEVFLKLLRTIVGESGRFPKLAKMFTTATIKPGVEKLTKYLSEHKDIEIEDPEAFARIFIGALAHHNMHQHILYGSTLLPFESSRIIDELIRLFSLSCLKQKRTK